MKAKPLLTVTVLGMAILVTVAAIATVAIVFGASPQPASGPPTAALTPVVATGSAPSPQDVGQTDSQPGDAAGKDLQEEEEDLGPRHPAGMALPLEIGQATRDALAAAARASGPSGRATDVATGGTIYYGIIYGKTKAADVYHTIASLKDGIYHWTRQGDGKWKYAGVYDARVCDPPVPARLYRAWGLTLNTDSPEAPANTACPR
ncbi:hypothetical protein [Sinosporangium siamense]|uniref:Uncharacterized protein n=1 Tax=Sinosporangium siamense TaxID=1367973 RepID=A0A919RJC3_9ACTN|nr:hypothetical protein [Sinosporangium siamense]GII93419.1 hypothetical protein Ssi02_36500 [Sinosporangium siamense]